MDGCSILEPRFKIYFYINCFTGNTCVFHLHVFLQYDKHQVFDVLLVVYACSTCKSSCDLSTFCSHAKLGFVAILGEAGSNTGGSMFLLTPGGNTSKSNFSFETIQSTKIG